MQKLKVDTCILLEYSNLGTLILHCVTRVVYSISKSLKEAVLPSDISSESLQHLFGDQGIFDGCVTSV